MSAPSMRRFEPPPLEVDATTRWVLRRAFGPVEDDAPTPDPGAALERAGKLGLAPRIAARIPEATLRTETNEETGYEFVRQSRRALEAALAYEAIAHTLAQRAGELEIELVFLKGYALHAGGYTRPGGRAIGDLDLLVAADRATALHRALGDAGFTPAEGPANEQHLPPLAAPGWGVVDLHYALRGVCDEAGDWLDAARTIASPGSKEVAPGCWIPGPAVLAAHALVHTLEQHANNPRPYPLLRLLGDLHDILPDDAAWEGAAPMLLGFLAPTLAPEQVRAARALAATLREGQLPGATDSAESLLLAHCLAHALDADYRNALRGRHLRHRLRQARRRGTLLRYAGRKLNDLLRRLTGASNR